MSIAYRDAEPADAAAMAALGRRTFIETFGHLYTPEDRDAFLVNHSADVWAAQLASPDYAIRIAEAGDGPVGYAKLGPMELPFATERRAIELHQLYIVGEWQGHRIGRELMAWTLAEARRRRAEEIYLSVWTQNHRARAFYRGYGFDFVAPYAFMVGNQADEDEIFRLVLAPAA
jgi:ribosomal protein S18 acetylase RimI-like enzyme